MISVMIPPLARRGQSLNEPNDVHEAVSRLTMETDAALAPDTARIGIDIIRLDHIMRFEPLPIDHFDWIAGMGMFVGTEHGSFPLWK